MNAGRTPLPPGARLQRDPLAAIAVPLAPIVLEGRYRLLVGALWRLGRSRRGRWAVRRRFGGARARFGAVGRSPFRDDFLAACERRPRSSGGGGPAPSSRPGFQGGGLGAAVSAGRAPPGPLPPTRHRGAPGGREPPFGACLACVL